VVGGYNTATFDAYMWVFVRVNGFWNQQGQTIIEHQPHYGYNSSVFPLVNVAVSTDGNTAILNNAIWTRDVDGFWTETGALRAQLGPVRISADGTLLSSATQNTIPVSVRA
jgi:hypothetical protein